MLLMCQFEFLGIFVEIMEEQGIFITNIKIIRLELVERLRHSLKITNDS